MKAILIIAILLFVTNPHPAFCQSWQQLMDSSKFYQEKQEFDTALKWAKLSLIQAEKEFGKLDTNLAISLGTIRDIFFNINKTDSAIFYNIEHIKLCRTLCKGDDEDLATCISRLGYLYYLSARFDEAEPLYKEALEMCRRLFKGDNPNLAMMINNMALLYNETGRYAEAEQLYKEALDMKRNLFKGDHQSLAKSIINLASFYNSKGRYAEAELLFKEGLEMFRRLYVGDNTELAICINNLAMFYYSRGRYAEAETLIKEVLEMNRRIYKGDQRDLSSSINNAALIYFARGKYTEAEPLYIKGLDMVRRIYKGDHPDLMVTIINTAQFYESRGKYSEAEKFFQEGLEMSRRLYKGDHSNLVSSISNMAFFYEKKGKYNEVELLSKEALEMSRRIYKSDHPDLANSINSIAILYERRGRYIEAEPLFKETLEMYRRLFKNDHPSLATTINNMAVFFDRRGRYSEAEPLYKEALEMYRHLYKADHPDLAQSINNLSTFYENRGSSAEAELLSQEALEMYRRLFKGEHPGLARILNNMALLCEKRGKYADAESIYKEALEMYHRLYKEDNSDLAKCINNLAMFYVGIGKNNEAEPLLKEALEMNRRMFSGDHPEIARSLNFMALYYTCIGMNAEAEPYFKKALEMRRHLYQSDHPDLARSINNLAMFYSSLGRLSEAEPLFIEGLNVYINMLNNYFPSLSEKEKSHFWSTSGKAFDYFNSFSIERAIENPKILINFFNNQLLTKGLLINSIIKTKNRIINSNNSGLIRKFEEWKFLKEKISKLQTQSIQELTLKGIKLDSIINEANDIEKELSKLSEDFKKEYDKKTANWKDVQNSLDKYESAIEIVRFRYYDKKWTDTIYYAALIIKTDSKLPELVLLENGKDIEGKHIELYRNQINQQRKQVFDPEKIESNLTELYKQFWAPIQEKLKGIKKVYLSPDGVYNQINMNTLINPKTGKYLLEEIDLRIVTSTRDLISANGQQSTSNKNTALLFGDPQFNLDSTKYTEIASRYVGDPSREYYYMGNTLDTLSRQGISSLPGTRKEIDKISSDMKAKKWEVSTFLGPDAIEEAIKNIKSPRVLHIATHGKFMKDVEIKEERSFGMEAQRYVENPLLRSMLLFAGAENTIFRTSGSNSSLSQTEDGLLTAYEAMNLNLDNTELVVLSACETGLGEVHNGEGVYGLQRAFQVAGAKSLIMSLWSVSDDATQQLMTSFYSKWLGGKEKRTAFREAQMELKKKYPGFYYWGAFVMVGE